MSRIDDLWHRKDRTRTAQYGKGKRWQAVWTDGRGGEEKKSHQTKDAAKAWLDLMNQQRSKGVAKDAGRVLILELQDEWFASVKWEDKTWYENKQTWKNYIIPSFGKTLLEDLDRKTLRDWVTDLEEKLSAATVSTYFGRLSAFLTWCVEEKRITENPARGVALKEPGKRAHIYLLPVEYHRLRRKIHEHYADACDLAVTTGMRPGELWELRAGDVDLERQRLHIERAVTEVKGRMVIGSTKTGEPRSIPITDDVTAMLSRRVKGRDRSHLVFSTVRGAQVRQSNFGERYWRPAAKAARMPEGMRFYDLRHTAASWAIYSGASVMAVQRMLGHAKPTETLNRYTHLFDSELDTVAERIGSYANLQISSKDATVAA